MHRVARGVATGSRCRAKRDKLRRVQCPAHKLDSGSRQKFQQTAEHPRATPWKMNFQLHGCQLSFQQSLVGANPRILAVPGEHTPRMRDDPKLSTVVPRRESLRNDRVRAASASALKLSNDPHCQQPYGLYLSMAELIPFPPKSAAPSKCSTFSRCSDKLICPSCQYVACSSSELHAHVERMHPLTPGRSMPLQFGQRPGVEEDLK